MAESITVARPYAQAIYEIATQDGTQKLWQKLLENLSVIVQNEEVLNLIKNPLVGKKTQVELIQSILNGSGKGKKNNAPTVENFLLAMAENHRLALIPDVLALFRQYLALAAGEKEAVIYSAFPLDEAQTSALVKEYAPHFGGAKLTARVVVDKSLIGGVRVCVGDKVLDTSVRNQLANMAVALSN